MGLKRKRDEESFNKRRILCLTNPSYLLARGGYYNLRHQNRTTLYRLLQKLVRQHSWAEAAAVHCVLLEATRKDKSAATNRFKYLVSMQLLKHLESEDINSTAINRIYDTWMSRVGINLSSTGHTKQGSFVVRLESILFQLLQGNIEDERQNARSLMQEHRFESHSVFNMIIGLIFFKLWYSCIPVDMQWKDSNQMCTSSHADMSPARYSCERGDSEGHNAVFDEESAASFQYDSASSVMKDKKEENLPQGLREDNLTHGVLHHGFYVNSAENDVSVDNDGDHIVSNSSSFWSLDSWLLPLQTKNWGMDRIIKDDEYWHAVKYLQEAVNSTPPLLAALLPLIQLLLIGCNGKDALNELEKFCSNSSTAFPFRLLANILEHVDPNNSLTLSTCYEDTLRRDPTCSHTLTKLLTLHRNGIFSRHMD